MNNKAKPLTDYVNPETLRLLATPSNIRLREEIAQSGGIILVESDPSHIIARVKPKSGLRRRVELNSTEEGLKWQCTCTRTKLFCKHYVAALVAAGHNSKMKPERG